MGQQWIEAPQHCKVLTASLLSILLQCSVTQALLKQNSSPFLSAVCLIKGQTTEHNYTPA